MQLLLAIAVVTAAPATFPAPVTADTPETDLHAPQVRLITDAPTPAPCALPDTTCPAAATA